MNLGIDDADGADLAVVVADDVAAVAVEASTSFENATTTDKNSHVGECEKHRQSSASFLSLSLSISLPLSNALSFSFSLAFPDRISFFLPLLSLNVDTA